MAVTGPKTDLWLVRTVGVLIVAAGTSIGTSAWRGRPGYDIILLAILSASGLAAIDIGYVLAGVIARIYLLDAAAEIVLIAAWGVACFGYFRKGFGEGVRS